MPRSTESLKLVNAGLAKQSPVTTRFSRACSGARLHISRHWVGWDSSCSCVPERVQSHDWEWHHLHRCQILSPFYVVCPCLKERDQAVCLRTTVRCCWESSSGCVQGRQYKDFEAPVPETPGLDTPVTCKRVCEERWGSSMDFRFLGEKKLGKQSWRLLSLTRRLHFQCFSESFWFPACFVKVEELC